MERYADKVVVITGGDNPIGLATAQAFLSEGAKVVIAGRKATAVSEIKEVLGTSATVIAADVARREGREKLVDITRETHGRIDVLFVGAGVAMLAPFENSSEALFDEIFDTNIRGAYFTIQKTLPLISDGGAIVVTTSWLFHVGITGTTVVSAAKAALRSLARTIARELLPRRIRINVVSPDVTEAPLLGNLGVPEETLAEIGKEFPTQIPQKRFDSAEEVAKAVLFLSSNDAGYITGVELAVDGRRTEL